MIYIVVVCKCKDLFLKSAILILYVKNNTIIQKWNMVLFKKYKKYKKKFKANKQIFKILGCSILFKKDEMLFRFP